MSQADSGGRDCEYSHDISGERFDDIPGDTWSCPHESESRADRCPVHRPSASPEEVRSFIADACERREDDPQRTRFFGANCSELDLGHLLVDGGGMFPIDLRDATVGDVNFENSRIQPPVSLAGATVEGTLDCEQAVFRRDFEMCDVTVEGDTSLGFAQFESWCSIRDTHFGGDVVFNGATFARGIDATKAVFTGQSDFINTNFEEMANFRETRFTGTANFAGPEFFLDARFDGSTFEGPSFFETTKFHQVGVFRGVVFEGPVSFRNCLAAGRASFQNATFEDSALFPGVEFESIATFNGAEFRQDVNLRDASIEEIKFEPTTIESSAAVVKFTKATIRGGTVQVPEHGTSIIKFTNATLGDVELRSNRTEFVLNAFILDEVQYDGFRFDRLEDEFRNGGGNLEAVRSTGGRHWLNSVLSVLPGTRQQNQSIPAGSGASSPQTSSLERTYRKAKNGADSVGEPKISSYFFRREMRYRRQRHWETVRNSEVSRARRLTAGFRWTANAVLYVAAGYGERPSWTIISSIVSILIFAGIYAGLGVYDGNAHLAESLLFSAQSFVTFIVGKGPETAGLGLRALSVLQGFIGAFLVAVFVFTLTRTVYR